MKDDGLENYRDREHGYIKHRILETYLLRVFNILGKYEERINFVDGFAGFWKSQDDEHRDTSPGISVECMLKCRDSVQKGFGKDVQFRGLYVEKGAQAHSELSSFLNEKTTETGIELQSLRGEFESSIDQIVDWCGDAFTFFFIDPKGWSQSLPTVLAPLLGRTKSEFLINLQYDHINRFVTDPREFLRDQMIDLFGEVPENLENLASDTRENTLANLYRSQISSIASQHAGERIWTAYEPVRDPDKARTKYHLVYLTRHHKGVLVFKECSEQLGELQDSVRAVHKLRQEEVQTGQPDLFPTTLYPNESSSDLGAVWEIENYIVSELAGGPKRFGEMEIADILNRYAWRLADIQQALLRMIKEEKSAVNDSDPKRRRRKKPLHYWAHRGDGEFLRLC